ncbi:unnamed protein product [Pseudo-nitzschia multistriata]|uniref:Exostosin GT47 domain-containing protein n=1 Tax=Pseudo-nitzschia multistriata TaxID=183589 RepID=A0A448Z893_9STRA|nr:unnamed protein product [Pseudo-nitzschia multistriata]
MGPLPTTSFLSKSKREEEKDQDEVDEFKNKILRNQSCRQWLVSESIKIAFLLSFGVVLLQWKIMKQVDVTEDLSFQPFVSGHRALKTLNAPLGEKNDNPKYRNCPFRDSPIVESIYVYPHPGSPEWKGDILSNYTRIQTNSSSEDFIVYPWIDNDLRCKAAGVGPYDGTSQLVQYNTELLVRDIITHPDSCLRTNDPEKATLFYVPYLPSAEYKNGTLFGKDMSQSKYGKAIQNIITKQEYESWEKEFGLTSEYWKRRNGSDHILVFSEPMHGLWHPKSRRGNFHFLHSQFQTHSPIVISNELSKTFIDMYPLCARKNILVPYPNTNGRWFNGALDNEAVAMMTEHSGIRKLSESPGAIQSEIDLAKQSELKETSNGSNSTPPRLLGYYYSGGNHGTCVDLRKSMKDEFRCSPSGKMVKKYKKALNNYAHGYRQSTFCPCPGGDSPSAKRNFDSVFAGCIPVILSEDFVWPFTSEFDRSSNSGSESGIVALNPYDFSIRLNAKDHWHSKFDSPKNCNPKINTGEGHNETDHRSLQSVLEAVPSKELARLRQGLARAAEVYSYYRKRPDLPDEPLREGLLPDGGAAHMLVRALAERASGALWNACRQEMKGKDISKDSVKKFKC